MPATSRSDVFEDLRGRIVRKSARVCVIGLGYVGIPVAATLAAAGFQVTGVDRSRERVDALRKGALPLASTEPNLLELIHSTVASAQLSVTMDPAETQGFDVFVICVDTPIGDDRQPRFDALLSAVTTVGKHAGEPALVIIESTIAPGTMRRVVAPVLQGSDRRIAIAHCPERVRPGRLLANLRSMPRLVGAESPQETDLAIALYGSIVEAPLVATTWAIAEVVKTAENAVRDVQIAIANQIALVSDYVGVDVRRVRDQINELWRDQPLVLDPGPGVGGYCLPKDPWLLISPLRLPKDSALIRGAREVNDGMPEHIVSLVLAAATKHEVEPARVTILGLTYDVDSDDGRNAPGPRIAEMLRARGCEVATHDPHTSGGSVYETVRGADIVVFVVPHSVYVGLDYSQIGEMMRNRIVIDCRRRLDSPSLRALGFKYYGLGLGDLSEELCEAQGDEATGQ